jgi:ribose 5-phosphate isomerase B
MKIIIGSDHAGFSYKREIIAQLRAKDITVTDVGTDSEAPVSYVPFIREAMAANRIKGVRCALCWNVETAKLARQHNDANVLSIGERMIDIRTMIGILNAFLETPFDGGRHEDRIRELDE